MLKGELIAQMNRNLDYDYNYPEGPQGNDLRPVLKIGDAVVGSGGPSIEDWIETLPFPLASIL